ncbi:hypothetical protein HGRIS_004314 [Hohenbuehelia grisea]|uniref:Uncharacterized protein n=1 Tax=Hohenbuehelia grisea TaxID=104357 RepID=A0ABR3IPD4_9AGAR
MLTIICQRLAERRFAIPACVVCFLNDICNPPQPDTNSSQPVIGSSKPGPSSFQPGTSNNAGFSQPSSVFSQCGARSSQLAASSSQPSSVFSQRAAVFSQPGAGSSQHNSSASQPDSSTSQPAASTSQPTTSSSQPGASSSQPSPSPNLSRLMIRRRSDPLSPELVIYLGCIVSSGFSGPDMSLTDVIRPAVLPRSSPSPTSSLAWSSDSSLGWSSDSDPETRKKNRALLKEIRDELRLQVAQVQKKLEDDLRDECARSAAERLRWQEERARLETQLQEVVSVSNQLEIPVRHLYYDYFDNVIIH